MSLSQVLVVCDGNSFERTSLISFSWFLKADIVEARDDNLADEDIDANER